MIYGIALPYFTLKVNRLIFNAKLFIIQLAKIAFRPWCEKIASLFDDHSHDREVDAAKQEESSRVINLMRSTAERIKKEEADKHGVVIIEAKFVFFLR